MKTTIKYMPIRESNSKMIFLNNYNNNLFSLKKGTTIYRCLRCENAYKRLRGLWECGPRRYLHLYPIIENEGRPDVSVRKNNIKTDSFFSVLIFNHHLIQGPITSIAGLFCR